MEELDFEFIKDRGIGELISDYLSLFKKIFKHFNKSIFKFLLPFLAVFLVLFFFASTLGVDIYYDRQWGNPAVIFSVVVITFLILFFYFLFISPFGIEYMFLLQGKNATSFTGGDVWRQVKKHIGKYIRFFFASIGVTLILSIPLVIASIVVLLIPIVGGIALGILFTCISLVFMCGIFLYLKGREKLFDSYFASWKLLKKKIFVYGLAAYIFRILIGICLGILTIIPIIIIAVISINSIGLFNQHFFVSFTGKLLLSIGGTIFMLFSTISTIYSMAFYVLIYFSSLETTNKEGTLEQISQIGIQKEDET